MKGNLQVKQQSKDEKNNKNKKHMTGNENSIKVKQGKIIKKKDIMIKNNDANDNDYDNEKNIKDKKIITEYDGNLNIISKKINMNCLNEINEISIEGIKKIEENNNKNKENEKENEVNFKINIVNLQKDNNKNKNIFFFFFGILYY